MLAGADQQVDAVYCPRPPAEKLLQSNFILHKVGSRAILPLRQNNAAIGPQQMCLAVCGKVQQ